LFEIPPLKAQNDYKFQKFGEAMAVLAPPGYAYELHCTVLLLENGY